MIDGHLIHPSQIEWYPFDPEEIYEYIDTSFVEQEDREIEQLIKGGEAQ